MQCEIVSIDGTVEVDAVTDIQARTQSHSRRNGLTVAEKQFRIPRRQPMNWSLPDDTNQRQQSKISIWIIIYFFSSSLENGTTISVTDYESRVEHELFYDYYMQSFSDCVNNRGERWLKLVMGHRSSPCLYDSSAASNRW
ncbi:hypothetical protein NPIL_598421 [Nephila pilipes]|uniref:Uncharacterized protein n=1 Tax=Nephila pilipes TaxID=299642 RepID=A0A8X6NFR9_NEPPI|nr:hypothetical protein NPIL_598421 [Nephila pilipes]